MGNPPNISSPTPCRQPRFGRRGYFFITIGLDTLAESYYLRGKKRKGQAMVFKVNLKKIIGAGGEGWIDEYETEVTLIGEDAEGTQEEQEDMALAYAVDEIVDKYRMTVDTIEIVEVYKE